MSGTPEPTPTPVRLPCAALRRRRIAAVAPTTPPRPHRRERIAAIDALEKDGWELMDVVNDEFACLHNVDPRPLPTQRVAAAWAIVERWDYTPDADRWPRRGGAT